MIHRKSMKIAANMLLACLITPSIPAKHTVLIWGACWLQRTVGNMLLNIYLTCCWPFNLFYQPSSITASPCGLGQLWWCTDRSSFELMVHMYHWLFLFSTFTNVLTHKVSCIHPHKHFHVDIQCLKITLSNVYTHTQCLEITLTNIFTYTRSVLKSPSQMFSHTHTHTV